MAGLLLAASYNIKYDVPDVKVHQEWQHKRSLNPHSSPSDPKFKSLIPWNTGEWDEAQMGACAEGLPWPVLDKVRAMGLPGRIDPASVVLETLSPGKIHPTSTEKLSPSQVGLLPALTIKVEPHSCLCETLSRECKQSRRGDTACHARLF